MSVDTVSQGIYVAEMLSSGVVLTALYRRKALREFGGLALLVIAVTLDCSCSLLLLYHRAATGLDRLTAYHLYFTSHWTIYLVQSLLLVTVMHNVFSIAMRPFAGLSNFGRIIFRWIGAISLAMMLSIAVGARVLSSGVDSTLTFDGLCHAISQGISVLLLCLMLFVCFAIKPLGLTFRSRIFGVSFGLGVYAVSELLEEALVALAHTNSLYSPLHAIGSAGAGIALMVWGVYFILPEPKARMVMLPTTSPYFSWNKVSEALGDDPGDVVIAGFTPDMLASGELHVLTEMSKAAAEKASHERPGRLRTLNAA